MEGKKLFQAAKIVSKACGQIQALGDALYLKLEKELKQLENVSDVSSGYSKYENDSSTWLSIRWMEDLAITDSPKRKPTRHVAFQIFLYDEGEDAMIKNWEPSIYIIYGPGRDSFEDDSIRITSCFEDDFTVLDKNDNQLWRWYELSDDTLDSWFFAVPLVKINNESDLQEQIVNPVISLLKTDDPKGSFPDNSCAYKFNVVDGNISISYS